MNIYPYTHHLRQFATPDQLQSVSVELCRKMVSKILVAPPTKESWSALLELAAVWPDANEIGVGVQWLEPLRHHWPWRMRKSYLGQKHTHLGKDAVYLLVGYLNIAKIEDLFGEKLARWSQNPNWRNLQGLCLSKMETNAAAINRFLKSSNLSQLEELCVKATEGLNGKIASLFEGVELNFLDTLRLSSLDLGRADILELARHSISQTPKTLDFSANHIIGRDLIFILANGQFPNLEVLNISYNPIKANDLERFIRAIKHPNLKEILIANTPAAKKLGKEAIDVSIC